MIKTYISRPNEERLLQEFFQSSTTSGFVCVRGRRRVGKSTLLERLAVDKGYFYFVGAKDERSTASLKRYARTWDNYAGAGELSRFSSRSLGWEDCFAAITSYAKKYPRKNVVIIFDEVQWLAKGQNGFVGLLKAAWLKWEPLNNIKVAICGSSYKFFSDHVGGEETILRGIRTRADIWIRPFPLSALKREYFKDWNWQQICAIYMMLGGIPYYLNQLDKSQGFIRSLSSAFSGTKSIFFEEINELLGIEFNQRGLGSAKMILKSMPNAGKTLSQIVSATGLSDSTVNDSVEKLVQYEIISRKRNLADFSHNTLRGSVIEIKDFYANFYYRVIEPRLIELRQSTDPLKFADLFWSEGGTYIPNFTGPAFELLTEHELLRSLNEQTTLSRMLGMAESPFEVCKYLSRSAELDLVVLHEREQLLRIFECKWTSSSELVTNGVSKLSQINPAIFPKELQAYTLKRYLVTNFQPSKSQLKQAKNDNVEIITADLFD